MFGSVWFLIFGSWNSFRTSIWTCCQVPTSAYGVRVYLNTSSLVMHYDRVSQAMTILLYSIHDLLFIIINIFVLGRNTCNIFNCAHRSRPWQWAVALGYWRPWRETPFCCFETWAGGGIIQTIVFYVNYIVMILFLTSVVVDRCCFMRAQSASTVAWKHLRVNTMHLFSCIIDQLIELCGIIALRYFIFVWFHFSSFNLQTWKHYLR